MPVSVSALVFAAVGYKKIPVTLQGSTVYIAAGLVKIMKRGENILVYRCSLISSCSLQFVQAMFGFNIERTFYYVNCGRSSI